jgi:hypothetical protein
MVFQTIFRSAKCLSIICAIAVLVIAFGSKTSTATIDYSPQFKEADSYSTTVSANNDLADIYYPKYSDISSSNYSFPVVLLLQGALVDKSFYADYASNVSVTSVAVPEPSSMAGLAMFGIVGLGYRWRKRKVGDRHE